jgi:hypothetical protein
MPDGSRRPTPTVVTARTSATPPARSGPRVVPAVCTSTVIGQLRTATWLGDHHLRRQSPGGSPRGAPLALRMGRVAGPATLLGKKVSVHSLRSSRRPRYLTRLRGPPELWFPHPVPAKSLESYWSVAYRPGGWVRLRAKDELSTGFRGTVYLQLLPDKTYQGRLTVHQAFMVGDMSISARTWRQVPIAEIERVARQPEQAEVLRRPTDRPLAPAEELGRYFDETEPQFGAATTHIRDTPPLAPFDVPMIPEPVQAPPKGRITDEFLVHVASAYAQAVGEGSPAKVIAEQAKVPIRTVHGWITEARKRGHLPPGRPGRAG